jgi:hypothetical protein
MKKIHVGFDIDPELFMRLLQYSGNMKIEVLGTDDAPKARQKLLPSPVRIGVRKVMVDYMIKENRPVRPNEIGKACAAAGYAENSASPQMMILRKQKIIKRIRGGLYVVTPKGVQTNG